MTSSPTPDPRHAPPCGAATGRAADPVSRPALFDPDARGLSDCLQSAMVLASSMPLAQMRISAPRAEAALFLHRVTGICDIEPLQDAYGRVTGARGRQSFGRERVFVECRLSEDE